MKTKILSILALLLTVTQGAWAQTTADIGRVIAADGKMYKTVTLANKVSTASGVVAYVNPSGGCYALSLTVATNGGSNAMVWGSGAATGSWIKAYTTLSDALGAAGGVAATDVYVSYHNGDNGGQWTAAIVARNYSTARPSGASAWSLPSAGDWNKMLKALAGTDSDISGSSQAIFSTSSVSSKLTAAGAVGLSYANFWTSTEGTTGNVWTLALTTDGGYMFNGEKSQSTYTFLRPFFTFASASNGYVVEYNANGGSGAPEAQSKTHGTALTLSSTVPTRDGYTFAGWATSAEGVVAYSAGGSYTTDNDIVLYAQWTPTYTATFAAGNDNEGWTIDPASDVEGATVTVSYSGENKVKSVTVQKRVAVGHELSSVSVGEIICSDGLAYAAADRNYLPTGVTASGMVVYLGAAGSVETGNSTYRGMAISLVDAPQVAGTNIGATTGPWADGDVAATDVDGIVNVGGSYSNAVAELKGIANTAYMMVWWPNAHKFAHNRAHNYAVAKPSGTSDWFEPTLGQWARMMDSFGGSFVSGTYDTKSATAVSNLNTALTNAGGTALSADLYWLSTEINNSEAAYFSAYGGQFGYHGKDTSHRVRAFFAF